MTNFIRTMILAVLAVWVAVAPISAAVGGPSAPLKLQKDEVSESSITLLWEEPKDKGTGLDGYRVYREDAVVATVSALGASYRDTGLEPGTSYTYKVVAFDKAKQTSPPSIAITVKTKAAPKAKKASAATH